ncbi:hypothetical protein VNO77_35923 [Canavalia gladiata]|uniref:RBR-type E3 ubiquitin transferase n=1 Tax=Canavalia gladiata TaxID=3824 RepID=A0AAN9PU19_CANGL
MDSTLELEPFSDHDVAITDDDASDLPSLGDEDDYIEGEENSTNKTIFQNYTVLSEPEVKRLQDTDIDEVSCVLSISRDGAILLLNHYEWSVIKVHEAWFDDEERVRKAVGLLKQQPHVGTFPNSMTLTCEICFDVVSLDKVRSTGCNHPYCIDCWKQYVDINIEDGPDKCLKLRCPQPSCDVAVAGDMIHELASESNRNKYDRFLFRSYVENNEKMKWCPAPACEYAVSYESDGVRTNADVTCLCYHSFCWICGEEAHSPVDCETVNQWITKNTSESENTTWILAYTKPCPRCKKPIEKNQGCMHITCKCGFHFCWLCLRDWSQCGYDGCNRLTSVEVTKVEDKDEEEVKRRNARESLEMYLHYYERWASNDFSRKKALEQLIELSADHIKTLSRTYKKPEADFEFIDEAWKQVVECRRVLKWTYAYGYYLPKSEEAKKEFFEYAQGEAEAALERLHQYAERELNKYVNGGEPEESFHDFRLRLMNLTSVNKNYFENLVRALESGELADRVHVKSYGGVKRGSKEIGESISERTTNVYGNDFWQCMECGHNNDAAAIACQNRSCPQYNSDDDDEDDDDE